MSSQGQVSAFPTHELMFLILTDSPGIGVVAAFRDEAQKGKFTTTKRRNQVQIPSVLLWPISLGLSLILTFDLQRLFLSASLPDFGLLSVKWVYCWLQGFGGAKDRWSKNHLVYKPREECQ